MTGPKETGALAYYHKPTREWWYIPTEPEGRKWRGPYRGHSDMAGGISAELGYGTNIVVTTVPPQFILANGARAKVQDGSGDVREAGHNDG